MKKNNISIHDTALAGFECAADMSGRHLTNVMNELESFALKVEEHDNLCLPPDLADENLMDLVSECKDLIWKVLNLNTYHRQEMEYLKETVEDDGAGSACIETYLNARD